MFQWLWSRLHRRKNLRQSLTTSPAVRENGSAGRRPRQTPFEAAVAHLSALPDGGAGRVRAISLADFRQSVGEKWARLADKVAIITDNLIRRYIGVGNVYQRQGDDVWLLAFPALSADEARTVATLIAQEISRHLLGERCVAGERPQALAACLQAGRTLDAAGHVDVGSVHAALAETEAFIDHLSAGNLDPGWKPITTPAHRTDPLTAWTPIQTRPEMASTEPWQDVGPLTGDSRLSLLWRPTWVAENEAISAYCARVVRIDHDGMAPLEGPQAYPEADANSAFAIDRFVAAGALRDLQKALRSGRGGSIIVPLSWSSLQLDRRGQLMPLFAELDPGQRQERLNIEVFRIPDDAAPQAVAELTRFLQGLCGNVLLRLRMSSDLLCRVHELGGAKVGLDLSELRPQERMNDVALLATLDALQNSAGHAGAGCYLWSARRRRVVGGVVTGGFAMVNGPGLMKDVGHPSLVMPAPRQRFALAS